MAFKLPGFGGKKTNIKGDMDRKYGHGDYARGGSKASERMKPGESKFQYDVRMRKEGRKTTKPTSTFQAPDPKSEIKGTFSTLESLRHGFGIEPPVNPNDKRDQSKPQNFGIIPGMTFGEAFAQAGKGGARAGTDPFFWIDPDLVKNPEQKETKFLYDFEKEENISNDVTVFGHGRQHATDMHGNPIKK
jgi:hypothetical protein